MIQTKVARVVSPTELVLAAGSTDGVEEGMEFVVYTLSDPVMDPDTGEDLGRIEFVKARLIAAHVQEKLTVVRTKSRLQTTSDILFLTRVGNASRTALEEMNVEKSQEFKRDSIVRVGDLARSVTKPVPVAKPELVLS